MNCDCPPKFIIGAWGQPAGHFPRLASLRVNSAFGYDNGGGVAKAEWERRAAENGLWVANAPAADAATMAAEAAQENRLAWTQDDEPDLNRWRDNEPADSPHNSRLIPGPRYKGWTRPEILQERYARCKSVAPHVPVFVNFAGPSITVAEYTHGEGHKPYLAACDWMSFDWHIKNQNYTRYTLDLVRLAASRLRRWAGPEKRLFVFIEVTQHQYHANARSPTPDEAEAMVNAAVESGATGIVYFAHTFRHGWTPGVFPNGWYGPAPEMEARVLAMNNRLSPPVGWEIENARLRTENDALRAQVGSLEASNALLQDRIRRAREILEER